jgi:hypothetical protein
LEKINKEQEFLVEEDTDKIKIGVKSNNHLSDNIEADKNIAADKLKINNKGDFKLMINAQITAVKGCDTVDYPSRICIVNRVIWQTQYHDHSYAVYSKDLNKFSTIKNQQLSRPEGLTATDISTVIVASKNALHELHIDGKYKRQISAGRYKDVTYYNGKVYALKYVPRCVEVYTLIVDKFVLTESIDIHQVQYSGYISSNRIYISQSTITVATEKAVNKYDHTGQLLKTIKHNIGKKPGEFGEWYEEACVLLCGVDNNHAYLYADTYNHRLQVCHGDTQWSVIQLPPGINKPYDVVVDQQTGVMWMSCDGKLYKLRTS